MKNIFMGGSRKISKLNKDIRDEIDNIINKGYSILIGDANGIDKAIQYYIYKKNYNNVTIFCMGEACRNNIGKWKENHVKSNLSKKDANYYSIKDLRMAKEADYGLMIWDGKSKGTLKNIINLLDENKKIMVYLSPLKKFSIISDHNDIDSIINKSDMMPLFSNVSL